MSWLVDTSVWSLALRRDAPPDVPEVHALREALTTGDVVLTTGVILQEVLQGAVPEPARVRILSSFSALQYVGPSRDDHVAAAEVRNRLRASGVQLGTIDALIARIAMAGGHTLLTTDQDFHLAARHVELSVWRPTPSAQ